MRALPASFRSAIAAYREKLIADNPDRPPPPDLLAVLTRWERHELAATIWVAVKEALPADMLPSEDRFIELVLQRRSMARRLAETYSALTWAEAKKRTMRHLRDKKGPEFAQALAGLSQEFTTLTDVMERRERLLGRQKENAERKQFMKDWLGVFTNLCGRPLEQVVRVLTEIVYGGKVRIGVVRSVRRPTTKRARQRDTRPQN